MIARLGDLFRFRRSLGVKQIIIPALTVVFLLFVAVMPAFADSHIASKPVVPDRTLVNPNLNYIPNPPSGCYWSDLESRSQNDSPYWLYVALSGAYHTSDGSPCYTYLASCEVEIDAYHTAGGGAVCDISDDTGNWIAGQSWTVPAAGTQFIYSYQWYDVAVNPGDSVRAITVFSPFGLSTGDHQYTPGIG